MVASLIFSPTINLINFLNQNFIVKIRHFSSRKKDHLLSMYKMGTAWKFYKKLNYKISNQLLLLIQSFKRYCSLFFIKSGLKQKIWWGQFHLVNYLFNFFFAMSSSEPWNFFIKTWKFTAWKREILT